MQATRITQTLFRHRRKLLLELIVPILLCGYATYYYLSVAALPHPETNLLLIGPAYWFLMFSTLVLLLKLVFEVWRDDKQAGARDTGGPGHDVLDPQPLLESAAEIQSGRLFQYVGFVVLTVLAVYAMSALGFVTSIVLYTAALAWVLGVRSAATLIVVPLLLAAILWVGLVYFLQLSVPSGLLF